MHKQLWVGGAAVASVDIDQPRIPDDNQMAPPFVTQLKRYRAAAGLTQEELAARAGVSVRSVGDLERGAGHRPRKDTARLLAEALGLPPAEREGFVAAARQAPAPPINGDRPPHGEDHAPAPVAAPSVARGWPRWLWPPRQRWRAAGLLGLGVLVALGVPATAALLSGIHTSTVTRRPSAAPPPGVTVTVVGPHQAACCWARQGGWRANGLHGYPGFAGPTYWTPARGVAGPALAAFRWSLMPPTGGAADGRRVTVDVWIPDNNADARAAYVVTDGRGRQARRVIDQEFPAPGYAHRTPGWVRLGAFDATRDGRRWGGVMVTLTDRAPANCAAYHYASRTCVIGAAQARFVYTVAAPPR